MIEIVLFEGIRYSIGQMNKRKQADKQRKEE